jgi:LacI family transcriptional regulator, galactose operon repressor
MPVRMKDIARDLNVSVVTVSKVLRNHSDIGPVTRERVLQRVKELGYQPNWVARSLVTRRTYIIGLVVPDLMHSFFAEVAKGVGRKIRPRGYNVVISNSEEDAQLEAQEVNLLLARQIDGLILASAQKPGESDLFERIEEHKVPVVLIDRRISGLDLSYVGVDDEQVGRLATEHLIERGCRRIAHIRGPQISTGLGRLEGYRQALSRHGLRVASRYVLTGDSGDSTGYEAMRRLLALDPPPDGVFCYNDPVAAGAMKAALEAGLRVPEDLAVVGAGNVHYSDLLRVPLSTVDQSSSQIGEHAADLLLDLVESKRPRRPRTILLAPKLVVRDSTNR